MGGNVLNARKNTNTIFKQRDVNVNKEIKSRGMSDMNEINDMESFEEAKQVLDTVYVEGVFKTAEEIVESSPYKDLALIEHQDEIVIALVKQWNSILLEIENKTILFALQVKKLCEGYPEQTVSEIIDKVRNHPDLLQEAHSKDRILQGIRLVRERPDLLEGKGYKKKDGNTFWEFYFQLYKYQMDPGIKLQFEEDGMENKWSVRKLKSELGKHFERIKTPHTKTRYEKRDLIKELIVMVRCLDITDLKMLRSVIQEQFNTKLGGWKEWMKKRYDE